jgi:N utilization substance protein B
MTLPQQKFREIVLLLLYSHDFSDGDEEDSSALVMQELKVSKKYLLQAQELRRSIESKFEELDQRIKETATSYEFERIPRIERNILRLGAYELLYSPQIPGKVAISEAIRLSRKFASPESATFVNAVLDAIYKKVEDVVGAVSEGETPQ